MRHTILRSWLFSVTFVFLIHASHAQDLRQQLSSAVTDENTLSQIEIIHRILETQPADTQALQEQLLRLALRAGDWKLTAECLLHSQNLPPELIAVAQATLLIALKPDDGGVGQAASLLENFLNKTPSSIEVTQALLRLYENKHLYEKMLARIVKIPEDMINADILLSCALAQRNLGQYEEAISSLKKATDLQPESEAILDVTPQFERLKHALPHLQESGSDFLSSIAESYWSIYAEIAGRALVAANRAQEKNPKSIAALLCKYYAGGISAQEAKDLDIIPDNFIPPLDAITRIARLDAAIAKAPTSPARKDLASLLSDIGQVLLARKVAPEQ